MRSRQGYTAVNININVSGQSLCAYRPVGGLGASDAWRRCRHSAMLMLMRVVTQWCHRADAAESALQLTCANEWTDLCVVDVDDGVGPVATDAKAQV